MKTSLLRDIGLTDGETKVYLSLLRFGESTTGPLSKNSQVSSSKVYSILEKLIEKGLVGYTIKGKTKHFSAVEPKRILDYMDKKEKEFLEKKQELKELIPLLEKEQISSKKPRAKVFEGLNATKNFFNNLLDELKKGDEYFVIGVNYGYEYPGIREFFHNYHLRRSKKGIKVKMLANHVTKGNLVKTTAKVSEIRYLPQYFASNMWMVFYKNKVLISIWDKDYQTALHIESETAVKSFTEYFSALWKIAKP